MTVFDSREHSSAVSHPGRRLFVRGLVLPCKIGVHKHEKGRQQRVRISLEVGVDYGGAVLGDDIDNVVSYDEIVAGVRDVVSGGHINLVETLADRIVDMCLADKHVTSAKVTVEKLDVLPDGAVEGVETERVRGKSSV